MHHINELASILNYYFSWNKARITCLAHIVTGMILTRTVNLAEISSTFSSNSLTSSSYRRIQRFFSLFTFDPIIITKLVFAIFDIPQKITVSIDRTNWKFGKSCLNLFVISVVYKDISIPIYWVNLARAGSTSIEQRISVMKKVISFIGEDRISCLLGDREFIGEEWFKWLASLHIHFVVRVKSNLLVGQTPEEVYRVPIKSFFRRLKPKCTIFLKKPVFLGSLPVYLSASRSPCGNLLVLATPSYDDQALATYKKRWGIENLFGCVKSRGFNLEDTHITHPERVEKLFFVVVIAFCWAYRTGIEREIHEKIPIKNHKRKKYSVFRWGYDFLKQALFRKLHRLKKLFLLINFGKMASG